MHFLRIKINFLFTREFRLVCSTNIELLVTANEKCEKSGSWAFITFSSPSNWSYNKTKMDPLFGWVCKKCMRLIDK